MHSLTVRRYLRTIYDLSEGRSAALVTNKEIAERVGVHPGTTTSMLRTLSRSGLAEYVPHEGARLTKAGMRLAVDLARRQALVEMFLSSVLRTTRQGARKDAEQIAYVVSESLVGQIDAYLGHPATE